MMRGIRPNPFNASATVDFTLPADGGVRLSVYAATGRRIAVLVDGFLTEGDHQAVWHGRDQRGRNCPSAVYFLRLEAAGRTEARRIVLVK
jgi:flagellar hook assembly protein FlgD